MTICKQIIAYAAVLLLGAVMLCGCSDDRFNAGTGSCAIIPAAEIDPLIVSGTNSSVVGTVWPVPSDSTLYVRIGTGASVSDWMPLPAFPVRQRFNPGVYTVEMAGGAPDVEGFDCPFFYGVQTLTIQNGETARPRIKATLANTVVNTVYAPGFDDIIPGCKLLLHTPGGHYLEVPRTEPRPVYVKSGDITVSAVVTLPDSSEVSVYMTTLSAALPGRFYEIAVSAALSPEGYPVLRVSSDGNDATYDRSVVLGPGLTEGNGDDIRPIGWIAGEGYALPEGTVPNGTIGFRLSRTDLQSLMLTTSGASALTASGWPGEVDLLDMNDYQAVTIQRLGLSVACTGDSLTIDLAKVLGHLRLTGENTAAVFSLCGIKADGRLCGPLTLTVKVIPTGVALISAGDLTAGVDTLSVTVGCAPDVQASNFSFECRSTSVSPWLDAPVLAAVPTPEGYRMTLRVPADNTDLSLRMAYCGSVVATESLRRLSPAYTVEVDAYALSARISVHAADTALIPYLTENSVIYLNGTKTLSVYSEPELGLIIVSGLQPLTKYTLKATVLDNPTASSYAPPVTFVTEEAAQLPNSDFEDVAQTLVYKDLPSGGLFSPNIVSICNRQNHTDIAHNMPLWWATVNAKTFYTGSSNPNTWYMSPSTYSVMDAISGTYAVCLQCVGYDSDGEPIPDYVQSRPPYTDYSCNIPQIKGRAAGRLFLGSYYYHPESNRETFYEGHAFASRPRALNGYYKYLPTTVGLNEHGLVEVELHGTVNGDDVIIASGRLELLPVLSYTAFNVPLEYAPKYSGVKATSIRVSIAASDVERGIDTESREIGLNFDPATSTARGNTLWVDKIVLSY